MKYDRTQLKTFNRRAAILAGGKFFLLSSLVARMYYLQVIEADRYKTLANKNRISIRLLPPARGLIFDRKGRPLASNNQNYRVSIISEDTDGNVEEVLHNLSRVVPLSIEDQSRVIRRIKKNKPFIPVSIKSNLAWQDVSKIEVNTPVLPGVQIEVGETRYYPEGEKLAHILGYVSAPSEKEIEDDPLFLLPDFQIGKSGIEKQYEETLRGAHGTRQVEINAQGRIIRELERNEGQVGADLLLTIDLDLQRKVVERLSDQSAAAVVMDVHSGEILTLASSPSYDPNLFVQGLSNEVWSTLIQNPHVPLTNKVIAGEYAPGSTFKMSVALAALEAETTNTSQKVYCPGYYDVGKNRFHCWRKNGHGHVNLHQAIEQSCDVYFYEIAKRTGIQRIADIAERLGMNQLTEIEIPGERKGLIPTKDWKRAVIGAPWQIGETVISGIGQGYVLTTPIQLAVMTARICNGGKAVSPRLLKSRQVKQDKPLNPIGISSKNLNVIMSAMAAVTSSSKGTARGSQIKNTGYEMAGKTGTAQVRRITKTERDKRVLKNHELDWKIRDHALFVGYAPITSPKYCVAVIVEHGGSGSKTAAPIARDILLKAQQVFKK